MTSITSWKCGRASFILALLLVAGCTAPSATPQSAGQPAAEEGGQVQENMAAEEHEESADGSLESLDPGQALLGTWAKASDDACAVQYANTIVFEDNGNFSASGGEIVFWDVGSYEIRSATQVMISNAYDAEQVYEFSLEAGTLTLTDGAGCTFAYERA